MPVYLFTYHGYGTWLPDRPQGYVKRGKGLLPRDPEMANRYRSNMRQAAVYFSNVIQRLLIQAVLEAALMQRLRCMSVGTDPSHLHVLCSWRDQRQPIPTSTQIKRSLTRRLNLAVSDGELSAPLRSGRIIHWFSGGADRKRVREQGHLDYLCDTYLPDHPGWCWSCRRGWKPPKHHGNR